ncbi:MAG: hypothetical protein U1F43_18215 [Myxococcota bacterium]
MAGVQKAGRGAAPSLSATPTPAKVSAPTPSVAADIGTDARLNGTR